MTDRAHGDDRARGEPACSTVPELLERQQATRPGAPALVGLDGRATTYAELAARVASTAAALRGLGVARGDRVALVCANGPQAGIGFLGIAAAAVCAPLNPGYRRRELDFYLEDLDASLLVVGAGAGDDARAAASARGIPVAELTADGTLHGAGAAAVSPSAGGDVALALHTSGTTSRPKLVELAHRHLLASARNVAAALELGDGDRCLNVMPLFHIHGLVAAVLASLHAGAGVVCTPGLDAARFRSWLDELGATWYTAVPTMHQAILDAGVDGRPNGLRLVRSSSAALPVSVLERLESAFGCPVIEAYGMTEAAHQMASNPLPPGARKPGSVGPAAGPEIAILSPAGEPLPAGAVGEVAVRGENVFEGYAGDPDATREAFAGGWFRTGDQGYLDADGYLYLEGRLKEIVNRGGEKIAPREVDEVLLAHPAVAQAVTFARPHARLGEDVAAAVVPRPGETLTPEALRAFAAERLADFKVPSTVLVVDEIPVGPTGKLQRIGLAERLGVGEAGAAAARAPFVEPVGAAERRIAELYAELLSAADVGAGDSFFQLGGDSLIAAQLFAVLVDEGLASPEAPLGLLATAPTPRELAAALEGRDAPEERSVVALRAGGGPPLFLVPGHDGDVFSLSRVAREMHTSRSVYGLLVASTLAGAAPRSLEEIAAEQLDTVRAVAGDGPLLVGGLCVGAVIALEIARLAAEDGVPVGALVLVDPGEPRARLYRLRRAVSSLLDGDLLADVRRARTRRRGTVQASDVIRREPGRRRTMRELRAARARYRPQPYAGGAVLVTSGSYRAGPRRRTLRDAVAGRLDERRLEQWTPKYGDGAGEFAALLDDLLEGFAADGRG